MYVGAIVSVKQIQYFIHDVGITLQIQHVRVFAILVLLHDRQIAGRPVSVHADAPAGHKAVEIALVCFTGAVDVLIKILSKRRLVIQRPFAGGDRIVQVRHTLVVKCILVEHGYKDKAIGGQRDHTRCRMLHALIRDCLVIILHPVILRKIQVIQLYQVDKCPLHYGRRGHIRGRSHHVVLVRSGLDGTLDLVDRQLLARVLKGSGYNIEIQSVGNCHVSVEHGIVDRLGIELGHGNLVCSPSLQRAVQDHDILPVKLEVLWKIVEIQQLGGLLDGRAVGSGLLNGRIHTSSQGRKQGH